MIENKVWNQIEFCVIMLIKNKIRKGDRSL
jgi:hypothetical protein